MPNPERPEIHEQVRILLKYVKENWATHAKEPQEVAFEGTSLRDVYDQAVAHLIKLEMDDQTNIATDTKVVLNDKELPWDEFEKEARASE